MRGFAITGYISHRLAIRFTEIAGVTEVPTARKAHDLGDKPCMRGSQLFSLAGVTQNKCGFLV